MECRRLTGGGNLHWPLKLGDLLKVIRPQITGEKIGCCHRSTYIPRKIVPNATTIPIESIHTLIRSLQEPLIPQNAPGMLH